MLVGQIFRKKKKKLKDDKYDKLLQTINDSERCTWCFDKFKMIIVLVLNCNANYNLFVFLPNPNVHLNLYRR